MSAKFYQCTDFGIHWIGTVKTSSSWFIEETSIQANGTRIAADSTARTAYSRARPATRRARDRGPRGRVRSWAGAPLGGAPAVVAGALSFRSTVVLIARASAEV